MPTPLHVGLQLASTSINLLDLYGSKQEDHKSRSVYNLSTTASTTTSPSFHFMN